VPKPVVSSCSNVKPKLFDHLVGAELIQLAKDIRAARARGEETGLTDEEIAFYDALAENESARQVMGEPALRVIATDMATVPCFDGSRAGFRYAAELDEFLLGSSVPTTEVLVARGKNHGYVAMYRPNSTTLECAAVHISNYSSSEPPFAPALLVVVQFQDNHTVFIK
jgi:Domain of unknown function (DUF3387)